MNQVAQKNILIVDDDVDFSETLQDILEPRGYNVSRSDGLERALDSLKRFSPHVALIDLRLGKESGIDLIAALKNRDPNLACLMMTAYGDLDTAVHAMQNGAYDYLRKPINSQDLLVKLERVFERIELEAVQRHTAAQLEARNEELADFNRRLRTLVRSATVISSCTDLAHFPKQLLIECAMSLRAKTSAFYRAEHDHLHLVTTLGHETYSAKISLPVSGDSFLTNLIEEGETIFIPEMQNSPYADNNELGIAKGSLLVLPLHSSTRALMAVALLHNPSNQPFKPNDRELALLLASFSAEAYHTLEAGDALRQSEIRYRTLLQNLPSAVIRCRADENLTVLFASDKLRQISGYPVEDFINNQNRTLVSVVYKEDQKFLAERIAGPKRFYEVFEFNLRILHASGNVRWVTIRGTDIPGDAPGDLWVDCVISDVTEKVEAEEAHRQLETHVQHLQKLESLGVLAGGIAHDFNNLMVPIMGYADMLLEDFSENDFARESLQEIQHAVERARDLVQQILTFSRQSETEKMPTLMHLVVKQALKLLRSSLPSTIQIIKRIDINIGAVLANPTQLHQVVMNIGTNAFHAMEEQGGKLEVTLSEKTVNAGLAMERPLLQEGELYAALEIRDNGTGMDQDTLSKIFDPFFTTKEPGKGTGLGLATTHGIVRELMGDIWAASAPGRGTTFYVYLPIVESIERIEEPTLDHAATGHGESAMVIDDDQTILEMAKIMVSMLGYTAETFADSAEAIEAFKQNPDKYHFILSDFTMPKKTGCDLAAEVRKLRPELPIVLTSGHGELIPKHLLKELHIQAVLAKPYRIRDLAKCLDNVLRPVKSD